MSINLLNEQDCKEKFQQNPEFEKVNYIFYGAYKQSNDDGKMIEENMKMFKNSLSVLNFANDIKRIHLNTGNANRYFGRPIVTINRKQVLRCVFWSLQDPSRRK